MAKPAAEMEGMEYLSSLPRRLVTVYLPLAILLFVLLFPFYWMATTTFKPDAELYNYEKFNPFWLTHPTLDHIKKLLFDTSYPEWMLNTIIVSVASTFLSLFCAVCAAYAIERLRYTGSQYVGLAIFLAYLVPPSILFIPLATMVFQLGMFDSIWALSCRGTSSFTPSLSSRRPRTRRFQSGQSPNWSKAMSIIGGR